MYYVHFFFKVAKNWGQKKQADYKTMYFIVNHLGSSYSKSCVNCHVQSFFFFFIQKKGSIFMEQFIFIH